MSEDINSRAMEIRQFNRFYTPIIGLINKTILESSYSLAESRVLLEIHNDKQCTASDLTKLLQIDPGYLSRMLTRFIKERLIVKSKSSNDGRTQLLSLTDKGRDTLNELSNTSTIQITKILKRLPISDQEDLVSYMRSIKTILSQQISIRTQKAGDAGYIAYRHCILYEKEYGLDQTFERYVLESLTKFLTERPVGNIWLAEYCGQVVGSIGIVGVSEKIAQLRWFLIEPEFRGTGLGRQLMETAMDFCQQENFSQVFLWTFQGLDAARHLYRTFGFEPTEQIENHTWKDGLIEEKWTTTLHE